MKSVTTPLVLVTAVVATSCTTAKLYAPDLSGPTAQIRFVANAPRFTIVGALADEQCGIVGDAGRITPLGGTIFRHEDMFARIHQRIGMPGGEDIPLDRMHEVRIPAEKTFVFIFHSKVGSAAAGALTGVTVTGTCDVTLSFSPQKDQHYEAVYTYNGLTCRATLEKIQQTASGILRTKEDSLRTLPTQCKYPGSF